MSQQVTLKVSRNKQPVPSLQAVPGRIDNISIMVIAGSGGAIPNNSATFISAVGTQPDIKQGDVVTTQNGTVYRVSGEPETMDLISTFGSHDNQVHRKRSVMPGFSLSFSPHALAEMAQFASFPVYMSMEVQGALQQGGQTLVSAIRSNMHWQKPSGKLEASIGVLTDSPYELQIGSPLPYARRREFGFTDMVDSLGRYFAHDPGAFYMLAAHNQEGRNVLISVEDAVQRALQRMVV